MRRLFGGPPAARSSAPHPPPSPTPNREVYDGETPLPDGITAVQRTASYTRHDGGGGSIEGFELITPDGRWLPEGRCGIGKWASLGICHIDVVGESHRSQAELRSAVPGEAAQFVPEPDPDGPTAISVRTPAGTLVGYVAKDKTDYVRKLFRTAKAPVRATFWCVHRNPRDQVIAVEVLLWQAGRLVGLDVPTHPPLQGRP